MSLLYESNLKYQYEIVRKNRDYIIQKYTEQRNKHQKFKYVIC